MRIMHDLRRYLLVFVVALLVASTTTFMAGCSQQSGSNSSSSETAPHPADANTAEDDDSASQQSTTEEADDTVDEAVDWPDECLDRHGDITVYAVAELTGEQLNTLLEEQDYAWSERNQIWVKIDGSAALVVNDVDGNALSKDRIAALGSGDSDEIVSYRLVTSEYSSAKRAINNLARRTMTLEDAEYLDASGIAVVSSPSQQRFLVFASKDNNVYTVSVYDEHAIAKGLFNREAGQDVGSTIDEAFEALTARTPGNQG